MLTPKPTPAFACDPRCAPTRVLEVLVREGRYRTFAAGDTLWSAGRPPQALCLLCRGVVAFQKPIQGTLLGLAVHGSVLGLGDMLAVQAQHAADATFLVPGAAVLTPVSALTELVRGGGTIAVEALDLFRHPIEQGIVRANELGSGTVPERVARVLARLVAANAIARAGAPTFVPVPLTRAHLADLIGCRPETLIRALHAEPLSTVVRFQREGFFVLDEARLGALVGALEVEPYLGEYSSDDLLGQRGFTERTDDEPTRT